MKNELLRHTLSTIHYRFGKSIEGYQESFGEFSLGNGSRSPKEIINHMYDVLYSTRVFIERESLPDEKIDKLDLKKEIERFHIELNKIDELLGKKSLDLSYSKRLIQGPISDIITHIGQISMLQRLNKNPIEGEDFSKSEIVTGLK